VARPATGQIIERRRRSGIIYAIRYRANGVRRYETLNVETREAAEAVLTERLADREPQFLRLFERVGPAECWPWQGTIELGYGRFGRGGGTTRWAHRIVFERMAGPIPEGHELHHECGNRRCVNPTHLRPVTRAQHNALHAVEKARMGTKTDFGSTATDATSLRANKKP
jgi:hypothetical protein